MTLDKILLVRHDVTNANLGYIQGQTDTRLQSGSITRINNLADMVIQEEGLRLEEDKRREGASIYIFSSDLSRTYGTAERILHYLAARRGYQLELRFTEDLKERGQGDLEGMSFEKALPILSADPNLSPTAEGIYSLLYSSNDIPNGERSEDVAKRLERFVRNYIQQLDGVGIVSAHLISGMNYLKNLLTDGNMLGSPARPYQHYPNLSVVRLERDPQNFMRYIETGSYGPPNNNKILPLVNTGR